MKRSILLILLLVFVMALTACQSPSANVTQFTVLTNAPTTALAASEAPTQAPTDAPTQAPTEPPVQHVSATAKSNTGKTTVTIEADIPLIDGEPWTIYACRPRMITEPEIRNMAAACFGSTPYSGDQSYRVEHREVGQNSTFEHTNYTMQMDANETVPYRSGGDGQPKASLRSISQLLPGDITIESWAEYNQAQQVGQNYYVPIWSDYPVDEAKIPDISLQDAQTLAKNTVAAFAPDYALAAVGITNGELIVAGDPAIIPAGRWGYLFTFMPMIDGRQMTYADGGLESVDYMTPCAPEYIRVAVDGGGVQAVRWSGPTEITGEKGTSTLLPWEQIEKIALEVLPLKYTSWERDFSSVSVTIYDIRLGYMRVLSRNEANAYELVPVWDFMGFVYMDNAGTGRHTEHVHANNSLLTINAIDGTVIDRSYGY